MSNEMAQRLKAAGFPQPAFAPLQWWYSPAEELLLACSFDKNPAAQSAYRFIDPSNPDYPDCWANLKSFCYAPTAQDILEALPFGCSTGRTSDGFAVKWQYHPQEFATYTAPTLVEALAKAYLAVCT